MAKEEESKRDRFVRLAENRTNKIIDMLRLLSNCSNTNNYEYTQKDVNKIFQAIEAEVRAAKQSFLKKTGEDSGKFTL